MGEATRIVWPSKGVVELESFDVGEPKETQVLVETENTLISPGTELAFLNALPNTSAAYPQHPGYNNVGRIRAVGAGVNWLEVGDRVVSPSPHASHILTGTNRVLKVPAGVEPTIAVYFNMAAIALGAVRKARIELGEVVLVLGQGLIGNLAMQLCRLSGGLPVIAVDLIDERLTLSQRCGADVCINPGSVELQARLSETLGRERVDVVFDATGAPQAVADCARLADYRGRVILLASTRGVSDGVNFYADVHRDGITIIGAHNRVRPMTESTPGYWTDQDDWSVVLQLMAADRLVIEPLTTDLLKYHDAALGYELLSTAKGEHLGVILDWREA